MTTKSRFVGANGVGGMAAVLVLAIAAGLGAGQSALAQSSSAADSYEVIDLGPRATGGDHWDGGSPAISGSHRIVWTLQAVGGLEHPAMWLDCAEGDIASRVAVVLRQGGSPIWGGALGINSSHSVVGFIRKGDAAGISWARAFVCKASGQDVSEWRELGTLAVEATSSSFAYGIDDRQPPSVVGEAHTDWNCIDDDHANQIVGAFLFNSDVSIEAPELVDLGYSGHYQHATARDVAGSIERRIAGSTESCYLDGCYEGQFGVAWEGVSSTLLQAQGGGARALGVNDEGTFVGTAQVSLYQGGECTFVAVVWEDSTSALVQLPQPAGEPSLESGHANRVSSPRNGWRTAVGSLGDAAVKWESSSTGVWVGHRLQSQVSTAFRWQLTEATDVSDDGWIVGYGWSPNEVPGGPQHAFLLKPILCVGDLDRDGVIGGVDLTLFLDALAIGSGLADLGMSGQASGADLALFLGNWGITCEATGCPAMDESSTSDRRAQGEATLQFGLGAMGFDCLGSYQGWCAQATEDQKRCLHECLLCCMQSANGGE